MSIKYVYDAAFEAKGWFSPRLTLAGWFDQELAETAAAYTLTAAGASFTLTGQAATLAAGRVLSAGSGSFTLTGSDAGLVAPVHYTLAAESGAFALTGGSAELTSSHVEPPPGPETVFSGSVSGYHWMHLERDRESEQDEQDALAVIALLELV